MNKITWFTLVLVLTAPVSIAKADFTMEVFASSAPNALFAGSSWAGYTVNAMNSIENGLGNVGDRSVDPEAYILFDAGENISIKNAIVSDFSSWLGEADSPAPFDVEGGNRMHFGLHIVGDGTMQFRMADIEYELISDDGNTLGFAGDLSGGNYSALRVGIDYGADMAKGGGDDTIITSGAATQLIDEFVYIGVGNAFDASGGSGSNQEKIDFAIADNFNSFPINLSATYTLNDTSGSQLATASTNVNFIPEPGAGLVLATVLGVIGMRRRRSS